MTDRRPVLRQLNVVARDVPAMVEFYETLGLEVPPGPSGWERDHVSPPI